MLGPNDVETQWDLYDRLYAFPSSQLMNRCCSLRDGLADCLEGLCNSYRHHRRTVRKYKLPGKGEVADEF
jgi:hypothetical protein